MRTKFKHLSIGTLSSGTLRAEDIAPVLFTEAEVLRLTRRDRREIVALRREWDKAAVDAESDSAQETLDEILGELYTVLGNYCPDYCYLGSAEGDGAEIGVYPVAEQLFMGFISVNGREAADAEHTHALEVNDHGNATLYRRQACGRGFQWVECWSIV